MAEKNKDNRLAFLPYDGKKRSVIQSIVEVKAVSEDKIVHIPLNLIDDTTTFEHVFEKTVNLGIESLAENIKELGITQPIIVRKKQDGKFELIDGRRRKRAALKAGLSEVPALVKEYEDDTATLVSIDNNLGQREEILPSERAKAYLLKMNIEKRQGQRNDLVHSVQQVDPKKASEKIGEQSGQSARMVNYYLRLNELIPELLDWVDEKRIPVKTAAELSYLEEEEQYTLYEILLELNINISIASAKELRENAQEIHLTKPIIEVILNPSSEEKKNYIKPPKPVYKQVIKNTEQYMKSVYKAEKEKIERINKEELESRIKAVIDQYLDSL